MAREATITYEQFVLAADKIKASGGKVTARAVHDVLGAGSRTTVHKFHQQWRRGQESQSSATDDTLDPAIARAVNNQIAAKVQAATAETAMQLADLQAETDILIAENERQAADLEFSAAALATLKEQHAALDGRSQQIGADAARTAGELAAERQAAEAARVELAKAQLRLEAVPRIEAEIEKVRAELLQALARAAELHEAAAVATARLEAEVMQRKNIEGQLAEARAEAKKHSEEAAELRGLLASAKSNGKP